MEIVGEPAKKSLERLDNNLKENKGTIKFENIEYLETKTKKSIILDENKDYNVMVVGAERTENKYNNKFSAILEFYFNTQEDNSKIEYVIELSDRYDSKVNNNEALKLIKEVDPVIKEYFYKTALNDDKSEEYKKDIKSKIAEYVEKKPESNGTFASEKDEKRELADIEIVGFNFDEVLSFEGAKLNLKDFDTDMIVFANALIKYKSNIKTDSYEDDEIKTLEEGIVFARENSQWKYCGNNLYNTYTNILSSKDIKLRLNDINRVISADEEKQIQSDINKLYLEDDNIVTKVKSFSPEKDGKLSVELLLVNKNKFRSYISRIDFNLLFKDGYIIEVPLEIDGNKAIVSINEKEAVYMKVILPTEKYGILDIKEVNANNCSYYWNTWENSMIK